ncbi:MAG: aminotransferase class V-fold PLP-dependent enzyme [Candidatus Marinimicrobia bacterium]|nr:aminotransferase class V-fold PLP-dependent enzyme [Candidatus Neomarinimicrobiota bacterium]MDD9931106.1 aminotransferase class V-fold PLP-dependent enzyme [Candidatus Neomarinimicrobiota bacterium]
MNKDSKLHMTTDEFRKQGHAVINWIADYYEKIEEYPVFPKVQPGDIRSSLPKQAPEEGKSYDKIMNDMDLIMPGITHWQSPNFHAYFPCATSGPAIFGDLISTGLGVNGMNWATSPSCTEVESHVLDWIVDMMDLPKGFKTDSKGGGVIQDTASSSSLVALIAAREKITKGLSNDEGCKQRLTAYTSSQSHSSIEKAVGISGIGKNNLRLVDVDDTFAMRPDHLESLIKDDLSNNRLPAYVCVTIGTTSSTAIDPLVAIGKICKKYGIWLHVDAAMAGPVALCPEYRHILDGLEYADSYSFNPHKWMLTSFDCSLFYVMDRAKLIQSLTIMPEYLKNANSQKEEVFDFRDWGIPLGRRFRSLKLWHVINYYGINGLQASIREHMENTQKLKTWIEQDKRFEIVAPVSLTLICFRLVVGCRKTEQLLNAINKSGRAHLTHTKLNDQYIIRFSVGQPTTTLEHLKKTWVFIQETAGEL